jgi:hypothetical protein
MRHSCNYQSRDRTSQPFDAVILQCAPASWHWRQPDISPTEQTSSILTGRRICPARVLAIAMASPMRVDNRRHMSSAMARSQPSPRCLVSRLGWLNMKPYSVKDPLAEESKWLCSLRLSVQSENNGNRMLWHVTTGKCPSPSTASSSSYPKSSELFRDCTYAFV